MSGFEVWQHHGSENLANYLISGYIGENLTWQPDHWVCYIIYVHWTDMEFKFITNGEFIFQRQINGVQAATKAGAHPPELVWAIVRA